MDMNAVRTVMKGNALFQDLDSKDLEILMTRAAERHFSPGDVIYRKGELSEGEMALIVSGRVQVVAENGYVVREMGAGELIGEVGTICREGKRTVTLGVVEPTRIIAWHINGLEGISSDFLKRLKDLAWKRLKYHSE